MDASGEDRIRTCCQKAGEKPRINGAQDAGVRKTGLPIHLPY